jgi:hypothetical protein
LDGPHNPDKAGDPKIVKVVFGLQVDKRFSESTAAHFADKAKSSQSKAF